MRSWKFALAVLVLAGTACSNIPSSETRHSGFLGDYSRLVKDPYWDNSEYWVKPGLNLRQDYDKRIVLEPARYYVDPDTQKLIAERGEETAKVLSHLNLAIRRELQAGGYQLVTSGDARSLRVRPAITGLIRNARDMKVGEYLPIGFLIGAGMQLAGVRDQQVRIFFETEIRNARTGEVLGQSVSAASGNEVSPSVKASASDTYQALDDWARQVRERLDRAYGETKGQASR
ncbi:DUF3313 domain-containing protein [Azotobacter chroococcum]|uniref:DUF3313 domain-containing protein n=1 Tax=Azotobacter chroococcum TaxID=353 RepID=A0A4Q9VAV6_9GAMM|nr:DUF3313 domain-containing protein [Azotobacter chroococcum]QQE88769.1 DUF3313 domain-containing protein [Azotobacter chroococcum]TBW30825.1 DUF3313 domain-containing protein [Azotobacter chroococcum]TKD45234.1 DUF3313 domain-containing protein [Azotobacter chroococcum]